MLRSALLLTVSVLTVLVASMPAAAQWVEIDKLTPSDAYEFTSVAISGNTAIVGIFGVRLGSPISESAHLFDVTTGEEYPFKLIASDATVGDRFGRSVAISGNTAIVGAGDSAYLFDVATGNQLHKLTAAGGRVAISGNTAIVGAGGSAYLFDVTTGEEYPFKLTASDAAPGDKFGSSVAISGNMAIVGADGDDVGGSAYLFDVTTGNQLHKLTASDAGEDDEFGYSVAINGNTAVVGADAHSDVGNESGSAYLFDVTTGNQLHKLIAADAAKNDYFGASVAISGNMAIVGADGDDGGGSAYLFDVTTGKELHKLTASDAAPGDRFGYSVAISGNTVIVGARGNGSAYVFVPEPSTLTLLTVGAVGLLAYARRRKRQTV